MITVTGISNSQYPGKSQIYFDIDYNNLTYPWSALVPDLTGITIDQYLSDNTATYTADIAAKEAIWAVCPKTKIITLPDGTTQEVAVLKEEVVFPTLLTPYDLFNINNFFGRVIQEISPERWFALSKLGIGWTLEKLIIYPNWDGLKQYIQGLLADGTLTSDDVAKINTVLLEQNINLGL